MLAITTRSSRNTASAMAGRSASRRCTRCGDGGATATLRRSLGTVFIGLIWHKNLPIMFIGAALFVLSLYSWLLTPLEPEHH